MPLPRVLLCGELRWADKECKDLFEGVAEVVPLSSTNRTEFFAEFKPGGKYHGVVGFYRTYNCMNRLGELDKSFLEALPESVKYIAHTGAGYNTLDFVTAKERGIVFSNTPGAVDEGTATTALYLTISALRLFSQAERDLRLGNWKRKHNPGNAYDLTGKTVAILGLGGIGTRFAEFLRAFPTRIVYHNRRKAEDAPEYCEYFGLDRLDEMLAIADVLSVHIPLSRETERYVDERMIRKLKKGAYIVNTARGGVIDEEALIRALEDGHLGGVGLDVFPDEPNVNPRLLEFPNATLLPHMGTETRDSQKAMEVRALTNLRDFVLHGKAKDTIPEHR